MDPYQSSYSMSDSKIHFNKSKFNFDDKLNQQINLKNKINTVGNQKNIQD